MAGYVGCKEKMNGAKGLNLHLQRRPFSPGGQIRILDQAHLAYVARAEIKMSILSFSFVQLWGQDAPACRSNSPLSTPFLEGEQKPP